MISYFNNTPMQISSFDLNGANGTSTFDRIQSTATWCIIIFIITTALLPGYGESGYGYGSEYDGELPTLLSNQCQHNHVDLIRILWSSYYDNFNVHSSLFHWWRNHHHHNHCHCYDQDMDTMRSSMTHWEVTEVQFISTFFLLFFQALKPIKCVI